MSACRFCDRTESEVASCPSAHATACSGRAHDNMLRALMRASDALAVTGNYVANKEADPTEVLFANGRVVKIVRGKLVVGWDRKRAEKVFAPQLENEERKRNG